MLVQNGEKWYRPAEYADMYGKSPQCVNGLIARGTIAKKTIKGKTYVSGFPPAGWERLSKQEALANRLHRMHPFDFQDELWEGKEPPPPNQEPFLGAWKLANDHDLSWRYVAWVGARLDNDPFKVALFFQIIDAKDKAFAAALIPEKEENPIEDLFEYYFNMGLFKILERIKTR